MNVRFIFNDNKKPVSSVDFVFSLLKQIVFALLFLFNVYSVISYLSNGQMNEQYRLKYIKTVVSEYSVKSESERPGRKSEAIT
jgi:hypothetical protein